MEETTSAEFTLFKETDLKSPPAGLLRKICAFLVDALILVILCFIICFAASSWLFTIGPYGGFIGLIIIMAYFSILDSRIGHGQTLGKRIAKIEVIGDDGQHTGIGRAMVRSLFFAFPATINSWLALMSNSTIAEWILGGISSAIVFTLAYTLIFNRVAGQGIHDTLLKTRVVHPEGTTPVTEYLTTAKIHKVVSIVLVIVVIIGSGALELLSNKVFDLFDSGTFDDLVSVRESVMETDQFFAVETGVSTWFSSTTPDSGSKVLYVRGWYKEKLGQLNITKATDLITQTIASKLPSMDGYDGLQITVYNRAELGIARWTSGHTKNYD